MAKHERGLPICVQDGATVPVLRLNLPELRLTVCGQRPIILRELLSRGFGGGLA